MGSILAVYGTRPELIKMAPLILALKKKGEAVKVLNTGQHRDMLVELEHLFGIFPDFSFDVMKANQDVNHVVSKIIVKVSILLKEESISLVIVQGDTATVLATAMAAYYSKVKIAHVEAGLRSFDMDHPFPEEFNRRVVSMIADYNFAPTEQSYQNLIKEKVDQAKVFITGNTVIDALSILKNKLKRGESDKKKILVTAHRRENHEVGIRNICQAILRILEERNDVEFVWPVHPNPNVKDTVYSLLSNRESVVLCEPLGYLELLSTMNDSYMIWTDSGGIQEEAPSFKKPVLILREVTERPEVVASGFGVLVGTDISEIVKQTIKLLNSSELYAKQISGDNPFGDGNSSQKIIEIIEKAKND
ncbi:MAG: UDP-N-acetylglucosamine 2-epimerase (non-hydrolyzing) [Vicingaceae bacterium]